LCRRQVLLQGFDTSEILLRLIPANRTVYSVSGFAA